MAPFVRNFSLVLWMSTISNMPGASAEYLRSRHKRLGGGSATTLDLPNSDTILQSVQENDPAPIIQAIQQQQTLVDQDEDRMDALLELLQTMEEEEAMSLPPTSPPSTGTSTPSQAPSTSNQSASPSVSQAPSTAPSASAAPSSVPTAASTPAPTTASPTPAPTAPITPSPTASPTAAATVPITPPPTDPFLPQQEDCPIPDVERAAAIIAVLEAATNSTELQFPGTPQGLATAWIIGQDALQRCPDDEKLLQRWVLAVMYFATGGDEWFQCSSNPDASDSCGIDEPFIGDERFLSGVHECEWAGISCNSDLCVTEVEFELNNLVGFIPTEMGLLKDLVIWGMERGGLTGTIPTEIAYLTNLIFLDLDFNELTGSITTELLSLTTLTQLDVNNNLLTGSIDGIEVLVRMEFLQIHDNFFTGLVPEGIGSFTNLAAFTLHETDISGVMPESVCDLLLTEGNGGILTSLIADCTEPNPDIVCDCCTDCRSG